FVTLMAENWNALLGKDGTATLQPLLKDLRGMIPYDEECASTLAGQAQNGLLCAAHCSNIILTGNSKDVRGSSDNCISAAEAYIYFVRSNLGLARVVEKLDYTDDLVAREIDKQLVDLRELQAIDKLQSEELARFRSVNYQYAIPPAVMVVNK